MSSQFFGLEISHTGLNAFQAKINTTANNVSNVHTKGYSKQSVNLGTQSALRVYQRYGSTSAGVETKEVVRSRDEYYDQKYWANQTKYGYYQKMNYYMPQIQEYFVDNSANPGFSTLFAKLYNEIDSLSNSAGDISKRQAVSSDAKKLTDYFNSTAVNLENLQETVNDEIKTTVDNINNISQKIALLNKEINTIETNGGKANELRDSRDLLVDELSEIVPVEVEEEKVTDPKHPDMYTGATTYTLKVNGNLLVDTERYNEIYATSRSEKNNQSDIDGLYEIRWKKTGDTFNTNALSSGTLKALFTLRDGNDEENLRGKLDSSSTADELIISSPSITGIDKMNVPVTGYITVNNIKQEYTSFSFETDAEGNVTSYHFKLKFPMNQGKLSAAKGMTASIGESVNYKGIPYYQAQLNGFLRSFTKKFNDIELTGRDLNGDHGQEFFTVQDTDGEQKLNYDVTASADDSGYEDKTTVDANTGEARRTVLSTDKSYYRMTAKNVTVNSMVDKSPALFAATKYETTDDGSNADKNEGVDSYSLMDELKALESKEKVYRDGAADDFLKVLYSDITVDTQEAEVFKKNYASIKSEIDKQRQSVSGVDEDEEALDLVKFQNAYALNSKVISTLTEMYDRLILNTGV